MTDNRTTERVDHPPRVREAIDELMREKDATDNRTTELLPSAHGTLTAEQVREAIERNFGKVAVLDDGEPVEWRDDWVCKVGINYKAIADELNARAERTCEIESSYLNDFTVKNMCWYEFEMQCGYRFTWDEMEPPKFCPNCGGAVKVVGE